MTDRSIHEPQDLDDVDFDKGSGLVPVVVQDAHSGEVRMLGHQSREAAEATLRTGRVHFWSRSRDALWMKGETSGHVLELASLHADCDGDTLLARVRAHGPTCHTGERSCFGALDGAGEARSDVLGRLDETLAERRERRPDGSYTVRLLEDANLRLKKLGEESAELVAALARGDRDAATGEAADLVYHVLVALRAEGVGLDALLSELERRAG